MTTPGITGSLLSQDALERAIPEALHGLLDETGRESARRRLRAWHRSALTELGPAVTARGVFDRLACPLLSLLGYRASPRASTQQILRAVVEANGVHAASLLVTAWGEDLQSAWRDAVREGIGTGLNWSFCLSGPFLRVTDSRRTYARRYVEFDLQLAIDDERTFAVLWGLLRARAMAGTALDSRPLLERAIEISEQHRTAVRRSLQHGVLEALEHLVRAFAAAGRRRRATVRGAGQHFDESLVVIYRILFLLFAEARGLVPRWHPVFRDGYTIESLRAPVELLPRPRGLWETLQAIARLAHRGCQAGSLCVPPFNGPLFSPGDAPLADSLPLDDGTVRQAVLALTTRPGRSQRDRIAYGDLGVEQLGGVYERLLDLEPAPRRGRASPEFVHTERRKATGSFYTPRSLTEYLVRRTLGPLVHEAPPERILALRVLDPAMGSGAFLVAACRYLAAAYEQALLREGGIAPSDIGDADRAHFRRTVAQQCLFGVDINPTAVHLGRLSLWLATLAADRPLTFLDHHLRAGNSLVGASPADIMRQSPPGARLPRRAARLPLFPFDALDRTLQQVVGIRLAIASEPGDTLEQVRTKERALARLNHVDSPLIRWKQVADLWCAGWFREPAERERSRVTFASLVDLLLKGTGALPKHVAASFINDAFEISGRERFFHWALEFPEVFHEADGRPLLHPGFDAVVGNPPWEMLRGDRGDAAVRSSARAAASRLARFCRGSGIYPLQGDGHPNLYQLFLERALGLVRPGGRFGLVLPAGLATDHGAAALRRAMIERTSLDVFVCIENRDGVFPIHRGLKFLLVAGAASGCTTVLPCRFGVRRPEVLDRLSDVAPDEEAVAVNVALVERLSGPDLGIPDLRSRDDVELVANVVFRVPPLGDREGWNVRFGRELNATDDRRHFVESRDGVPVLEGKQIKPFSVDLAASRFYVPAAALARLPGIARGSFRPRLAYRDVASAANQLTLIAAIIPAGAITTHTLFCLKTHLDEDEQQFLCGVFNSLVANYFVRLRVGTHVSVSIIDRLPVPRPPRDSWGFREIVRLSEQLSGTAPNPSTSARLQAVAARVYGLRVDQFRHILNTFPLVPRNERDAALTAFCDIVR